MSGGRITCVRYLTALHDSYERFVRDKLPELSGIGSWETSIVFGEIKEGFLTSAPSLAFDRISRSANA